MTVSPRICGFIAVAILQATVWVADAQETELDAPDSHKFILKELGKAESTYALAFSPNGKYLLSGGDEADETDDEYNRIVTRWLIASGRADAKWKCASKGQVKRIALTGNGKYLAVGDTSGEIHILTEAGKLVNSFRHFENASSPILHLSFIDDATVLSVCWHWTGHSWNIHTNRTNTYSFFDAAQLLSAVDATASAKTLVWVTRDWISFLSDRLKRSTGHIALPLKHGIYCCALNEGGTLVLAAADEGNLYLFDVKAKELLKKWEGHPECWNIYGVLALPGRNAFVTSDAAGFIKFWNHRGELLTQVRRHRSTITALAVSPDKSILATAGETQPIVLWDLDRVLKKQR